LTIGVARRQAGVRSQDDAVVIESRADVRVDHVVTIELAEQPTLLHSTSGTSTVCVPAE
jgi:hypothetical protein